MSVELWLAFVAASTVMLVIPRPTILTVISYSLAHVKSAKMPLVTAVALGDSTALVFSLLGLGALLATSAVWFTAVKCGSRVIPIVFGHQTTTVNKSSQYPSTLPLNERL